MAAAATRNYVYPFTLTETVTHVVGLVVFGVVFAICEHVEHANMMYSPLVRQIHDHGADFAWEGFSTFGALVFLNFLCWVFKGRAGRSFVPVAAWVVCIYLTATFGYIHECQQFQQYCGPRRCGDLGDIGAETFGLILTMVIVHVAHRAKRLRPWPAAHNYPSALWARLESEGRPVGALSFSLP